jgi:hypothetical protein
MTIADIKFTEKEIEYVVTFDSKGNPLEGGKNYKLHLSQNIPAGDFWSIIVYDSQTRLIIHTDQKWPSVFSNCQSLVVNQDGSVDIWFGPNAPLEKEHNWLQTILGKGWYIILRLYGPTASWFDKSWRPGEIEQLK